MASFLITGASRGLGLALVKELVSLPSSKVSNIIAGVRGDAPALDELVPNSSGRLSVIKLDVTNQSLLQQAADEADKILGDKGLDILVNNAGICQYAFGGTPTM